SIQEVGITPDIELVPARILKERIDLFAPPKTSRESAYDTHSFNAFARDEEQAKAPRERAAPKPAEPLRSAKAGTAKARKARQRRQLRVAAEPRAPRTQAGDTMDLAVTAHNNGTAPIYRLRAYTKSDNGILDRREFVFGQLQPHEKRTWTVPVKVPRYMPSRKDNVTVKFEDDQADAIEDVRGDRKS